LVTESGCGSVDAATQRLVQSVLSENDKALDAQLDALKQQNDQLRRQIQQLPCIEYLSLKHHSFL